MPLSENSIRNRMQVGDGIIRAEGAHWKRLERAASSSTPQACGC
jgi:hypothetical protein